MAHNTSKIQPQKSLTEPSSIVDDGTKGADIVEKRKAWQSWNLRAKKYAAVVWAWDGVQETYILDNSALGTLHMWTSISQL